MHQLRAAHEEKLLRNALANVSAGEFEESAALAIWRAWGIRAALRFVRRLQLGSPRQQGLFAQEKTA